MFRDGEHFGFSGPQSMLRFVVFDQLVLAVVLGVAELALVGFVFGVSALVIVAVADSGEVLWAVRARVGALT